ncbi:MAG: hypothetical protein ABJF10_15095 [Chthoniobacter sp.]|uniref:hypothetical protein n=1 Tax=Chthoniobacter sp. TaxID=2510640 RepID=UPI0032A5A0D2
MNNVVPIRIVAALLAIALSAFGSAPLHAQTLTRADALQVAESYIHHQWQSSDKNLRHGPDSHGVQIHTPDRPGGHGSPEVACWEVGASNAGVAYKWGGFDTPESFDKGVRAGKAAGDVYTPDERRLGGNAVSGDAVGIDCSGFVSRCWKLPHKYDTSTLAEVCQKLPSPDQLQPADIMNTEGGHVILFVKWLDDAKTRALFYEAAPFSKTLSSDREIADLKAAGYTPMRYRKIRD